MTSARCGAAIHSARLFIAQSRIPVRVNTIISAALMLLAMAAIAAQSAATTPPVLSLEQLREEFKVLRGVLEESQVGLDWYMSKAELDRRFEVVQQSFAQESSVEEFHKRLLPLVAGLGHGHTTLTRPVNGFGYHLRALDRDEKYLPFEIRILAGKLYVTTNCGEDRRIAPGTEIVSIDGRPVKKILEDMLPCLSADGRSETFKRHLLARDYQFHALHRLLYGPSERFELEWVPPGERDAARMTVAAHRPEEIAEAYKAARGVSIDDFSAQLKFEIVDDGKTAVLTLRSFYDGLINAQGQRFESFLADAFATIKKRQIKNLILDLRENEGGAGDYAFLLCTYLVDKPFRPGTPTRLASNRMSYLRYADELSDVVKQFAANPEAFVVAGEGGNWLLRPEVDVENEKQYEPNVDHFDGPLYLITNGGSFSATNQFIDLIRRWRRMAGAEAVFVGERNGGDNAAEWLSGGQMASFLLPHSRQRLTVPLLAFHRLSASDEARGAIPDHPVEPSIQDVIGGVDRELLVTRELIANASRSRGAN